MKGLIYKELFLSIKFRIISLSAYALLFIMCVLVRISSVCGNVADMEGRDMLLSTIFQVMALGLPFILYASAFTVQVLNDEKCRFRQYSHTLPLTEKQIVGSVYLLYLILFVAATLAGWVNYFIACAIFGEDLGLIFDIGAKKHGNHFAAEIVRQRFALAEQLQRDIADFVVYLLGEYIHALIFFAIHVSASLSDD